MGKLGWVKAIHRLKKQSCQMFFISNYMSIVLFWLLYEWNVNVLTPHPAIEISLTHIARSDKGSARTFKHSELLHKTMYLVLNFKSNLGTYGHDLLAYERDAKGAKLHPGVNCAHEHGLKIRQKDRGWSQTSIWILARTWIINFQV